MAFMMLGRFEHAWKESDAIRLRGTPDPHRFWNGEDIRGKAVIVRCLHGFGDAVQHLRFLPSLRERAARTILEVPPGMVELAHCFAGTDEIITWGDAAHKQVPHWDVQVEVVELPYQLRLRIEDLPFAAQYLHPPRTAIKSASAPFRNSPRPRVGVAWSCGEWNLSRSIPIDELRPIIRAANIDFWNLQGGPVRREWQRFEPRLNVRDAPEFCADAGLLPLAAFVSQLDLIITVDTLVAHLGGALGIPTWIMLQHAADWRWMVNRDDSPWYPSLRLFRQPQPGAWSDVIRNVQRALRDWLDALHAARQVA